MRQPGQSAASSLSARQHSARTLPAHHHYAACGQCAAYGRARCPACLRRPLRGAVPKAQGSPEVSPASPSLPFRAHPGPRCAGAQSPNAQAAAQRVRNHGRRRPEPWHSDKSAPNGAQGALATMRGLLPDNAVRGVLTQPPSACLVPRKYVATPAHQHYGPVRKLQPPDWLQRRINQVRMGPLPLRGHLPPDPVMLNPVHIARDQGRWVHTVIADLHIRDHVP